MERCGGTWALGAAATLLVLASATCQATDGYFANAYGLKSAGMGGASAAVAQEPFGGATNPATMAFLDNQWQASVAWFSPRRSASRSGSSLAGLDGSVTSGSTDFFIPELGINWRVSNEVAIGVSIYGNGLNTDYGSGQISAFSACPTFNPSPPPYNLLCGTGNLGVDAVQYLVSPYLAWQFTQGQAIGVAPIIAYQRFEAYGLQALANPLLSNSPSNVTNRAHEDAWGVGIRVGYTAQVTDTLAVGIAYGSRVSMSSFGAYQGLLAEAGKFDIPQTVLAGVAFRPTKDWLIALDYERIYFGQIASLSNPSALLATCVQGQRDLCLGGSDGTGFGWRDIDVWRFGAQWDVDSRWTLRAGYSHSGNPIPASDVTLNILAPAVVENHYSAGFTYRLDNASDVTGTFAYAQYNSVTGPSLFTAFGAPPATLDRIAMKQFLAGVAYSRRF